MRRKRFIRGSLSCKITHLGIARIALRDELLLTARGRSVGWETNDSVLVDQICGTGELLCAYMKLEDS